MLRERHIENHESNPLFDGKITIFSHIIILLIEQPTGREFMFLGRISSIRTNTHWDQYYQ